MLVCFDQDGNWISMQTHAKKGDLIKAAVEAGLDEKGLEEKEVTPEEWQKLWDAAQPEPEPSDVDILKDQVAQLQDALTTKGVLTVDDMKPIGKKITPVEVAKP
jgi:hypothetical protein